MFSHGRCHTAKNCLHTGFYCSDTGVCCFHTGLCDTDVWQFMEIRHTVVVLPYTGVVMLFHGRSDTVVCDSRTVV